LVTATERYGGTTAATRYARTVSEVKAAARVPEAEIKEQRELKVRAEAIKTRIEKLTLKESTKYYTIQGKQYSKDKYILTKQDGTSTLKAKPQRYVTFRSGKNIDYGSYSPHVMTFKDGKITSDTTYEVYSKHHAGYVDPQIVKTYDAEGGYTVTGYKQGERYKTQRFAPSGAFKGGEYDEQKPKGKLRDYTTTEDWEVMNAQQKKAYSQSQAKKGIFTEAEKEKAAKLTPEAQIAEYGRVVVKTGKRLTSAEYTQAVKLTEQQQKERFGRVVYVHPKYKAGLPPVKKEIEKVKIIPPIELAGVGAIVGFEERLPKPPTGVLKIVKQPEEPYEKFMYILRKEVEKKEIAASREGREADRMFWSSVSTLTYPIRSKEAAGELGMSFLKGGLFVSGVAALEVITPFPVTPIIIGGTGIYTATKVPALQTQLAEARERGPVAFRESLAETGAHVGATIAGGYVAGALIIKTPKLYSAYKEQRFLRQVTKQGDYYWYKEGVSTRPLTKYESILVKSKDISVSQKAEIFRRAGGTEATARPTLIKSKFSLTKKDVQLQLIPKRRIIEAPPKTDPLKPPVYKDYYDSEAFGVRSDLGKYVKVSRTPPPKIIEITDIATGKTIKVELASRIIKPVTTTRQVKLVSEYGEFYFGKGYAETMKVPTSPSIISRVTAKIKPLLASKKAQILITTQERVWKFKPLIEVSKPSTTVGEVRTIKSKVVIEPGFFPYISLVKQKQVLGYDTLSIQKSDVESITKERQIQFLGTAQVSAQAQIAAQAQVSAQKQAQAQEQALISLQVTDTMQILQTPEEVILKTPTKQILRAPPEKIIEVPPPLVPPPAIPFPFLKGARRKPTTEGLVEKGYHAYVKRKQLKSGKGSYSSRGYEKVTKKALTKAGATVKAMEILDRYSNRSGYIKRAKQNAQARYKDYLLESLKQRFRSQKKNPNVFVEKAKYAISSMEERNDIPFEAMRLRKAKATLLGRITTAKKKQAVNTLFKIGKTKSNKFLKTKKKKTKGKKVFL